MARKTLFDSGNIAPSSLYKGDRGYMAVINRHILDGAVRKCVLEWIAARRIPMSRANLDSYLRELSVLSVDEQLNVMNRAIATRVASLRRAIDEYIGRRLDADNISRQ